MTTLLLDGVKYKLWTPQREDELEKAVKEHAKDIFGDDSIYFEKRKIGSELGIRSIPDGFVINFRSKKLYAIEIELSTHSYDHIVAQGNRHIDAMDNLNTKHKLVKGFNNEIKSDPHKKLFAKGFVEEDLHDFLTSISENPELVIIYDRISNDIKQAQRALNSRMKTKIIEFKTFGREDVGIGVHAHLFEPIVKREIGIERVPEDKITLPLEQMDTIVVPANEEGFNEVFIGENCWYAIRVSSSVIYKIKYIAVYQTAPISAITHYAEVAKIEKHKGTKKYIVYFKDKAKQIGPLKLIPKPKGKVKAPQAPRYTTFDKLKNAKSLDEVF